MNHLQKYRSSASFYYSENNPATIYDCAKVNPNNFVVEKAKNDEGKEYIVRVVTYLKQGENNGLGKFTVENEVVQHPLKIEIEKTVTGIEEGSEEDYPEAFYFRVGYSNTSSISAVKNSETGEDEIIAETKGFVDMSDMFDTRVKSAGQQDE